MHPEVLKISRLIEPVLAKYPISRAGVFGSFAHGTFDVDSDVDLLVEFYEPIGLFEFIGIKQELEDLLGRKVDLVEYKAVKPRLKKVILESEIPIYGKKAA